MITLEECLADRTYRDFFTKQYRLPNVQRPTPPWRLYVQLDAGGPWRKKDFFTYPEAFNAWRTKFRRASHDAAIQSRAFAFTPPMRWVKVKGQYVVRANGDRLQKEMQIVWDYRGLIPGDEPTHHWCDYCRRPTVFRTFGRHHAFTKEQAAMMDPTAPRCTICGVRFEAVSSKRIQPGSTLIYKKA